MPFNTASLCRWLVLLAAAFIVHGNGASGFATVFLTVFLASWTFLPRLLPAAIRRHPGFEWTLYISDTIMIAIGLLAALPGEPALPGFFFLGILVAILASNSTGYALAGLTVPGMYVVLVTSTGSASALGSLDLVGRTAFLIASGYYFILCMRHLSRTVHLYQRVRAEREELRDILEITDTITGTLDLQQVMSRIVRKVGERVGAESCSILLANDEFRQCFVLASREQPEIDMLEIDLGKYPELRKALETKEPVVVWDVRSDPLVSSVRTILEEKGYRSMLILPLLFGKDVLGTLFLRASRTEPFDEEEMRFCKVVAGASANALKNSLLYREVAREAEHHRSASEKLRRVFDCTPDMIVATDADGLVTEFSGGGETLTGRDSDSILGKPLDEVLGIPGLEPRDGAYEEGAGCDVVIPCGDGEDREVELRSAPLDGANGGESGRVWVGRDVTHIRRVERSLAQAERLSTLGEVVAGVAHELNNPLSAVLGYSELLFRNVPNDDLLRVVQAARRCKRIVMNLLSFARKHSPEAKHEDLNSCVRKVMELKEYQLRTAKIEPVFSLDPTLPATLFDIHQIEQVVLNLVNNAEQAIRQSGKKTGTIHLRTCLQGDSVCLIVEDDGPGIPEEIRNRVFDPFFTTKEVGEGTGLGLSVSFGIVRDHDGRLELLPSAPGEGTCFRLSLPLIRPRPSSGNEENDRRETTPSELRGAKILVADDEPMVLDLFARILEQDGAHVTRAADGEEAWERLTESPFDLIIADMRMPRLDGKELYERVADEKPHMLSRFIFATGDLLHPATVSFLENLPNGIVSKPLQIETVRHVLSRTIRKLKI